MEAEIQHRIIAELCSAIGHPCKAQIGFRMNLAKRWEGLSNANIAYAEALKRLVAVQKELLVANMKIHRRLVTAARLQAELDEGERKK